MKKIMRKRKDGLKPVNRGKGFTLVEIIVTLVILAVVSAIATPALLGYIDRGKAKECQATMDTLAADIASAKMAYEIDGVVEINGSEGGDVDESLDIENYIKEAEKEGLKCPSGGTYQLSSEGDEIECSVDGHGKSTIELDGEKYALGPVTLTKMEEPDATPTPEPLPTPSPESSTPMPEPTPTETPEPTPTETPEPSPTKTPTDTSEPSPTKTPDPMTSNAIRVWEEGQGNPVNVQYGYLLQLMGAKEGGTWSSTFSDVLFEDLGNVQIYDYTRGDFYTLEYTKDGVTATVTVQIGYAIKNIGQLKFSQDSNNGNKNVGENIEVDVTLDPLWTTDVRPDKPVQWMVTSIDGSPAGAVTITSKDEKAESIVVTSTMAGKFNLTALVESEKPGVGVKMLSGEITFNGEPDSENSDGIKDVIVPSELDVTEGETVPLDVQFVPADVADKDSVKIEYSYSSDSIIVQDGKVEGKKVTNQERVPVRIKISAGLKQWYKICNVRVLEKDAVKISAAPLNLNEGETGQIQVQFSPESAQSGVQLKFSTEGQDRITLDGQTSGKVTANRKTDAGSPVKVTVTAERNNEWLADCCCYVTVRPTRQQTVENVQFDIISWENVKKNIEEEAEIPWPQLYYSQVDQNGVVRDCFCILKKGQTFAKDAVKYSSIEDYITQGGHGDQFIMFNINQYYVPDVGSSGKAGDFVQRNQEFYVCIEDFSGVSQWNDENINRYFIKIPKAIGS